MQCLSHGTRAYIINADGLPGFVLKFDIARHLKQADEAGQLEHARRYQVIDISKVESKLESFISNEKREVEGNQVILTPFQQKLDYLSKEYPRLFILILQFFDMTDRIDQYMTECKAFKENRYKYSLYVHGYFLVRLDQLRKEGKLKQGT